MIPQKTLSAIAADPTSDEVLRRNSLRPGDRVVLTGGPYWGTPGVFVGLSSNSNWADLEEADGTVRGHPVAWISHSPVAPDSQALQPVKKRRSPA